MWVAQKWRRLAGSYSSVTEEDEIAVRAEGCPLPGNRGHQQIFVRDWKKAVLWTTAKMGPPMTAVGLGCAKTKSDLVVMPSRRQIFMFFALRMTTGPKIPGTVIPRRVFTQPGSRAAEPARLDRLAEYIHRRKRSASLHRGVTQDTGRRWVGKALHHQRSWARLHVRPRGRADIMRWVVADPLGLTAPDAQDYVPVHW